MTDQGGVGAGNASKAGGTTLPSHEFASSSSAARTSVARRSSFQEVADLVQQRWRRRDGLMSNGELEEIACGWHARRRVGTSRFEFKREQGIVTLS